MDTAYILVFITTCVLCVLLGIALILYVVPLRFLVRFNRLEHRKETLVTVSWSMVSICFKTMADQRDLVILVADHVLYTQNLSPQLPSAIPKPLQKPAPMEDEEIRTSEDLIPIIQHLIGPVKKIGLVLYRQSSFEDVRGTVRIGLGDPAATGMLYGGYWATRFVFTASRIYIDLKPDFDREILEMEMSVRFRIHHPLRILIAGIQVARTPDVMKIISSLRQKNRVAQ